MNYVRSEKEIIENVIIIGNGFDINLGHNVKLINFIRFCCKDVDEYYKKNLNKTNARTNYFKLRLISDLESKDDYIKYIPENKDYNVCIDNISRIELEKAHNFSIEKMKEHINSSFLFKYYKTIMMKGFNESDWGDVEGNLSKLCVDFASNNENEFLLEYLKVRNLNKFINVNKFVRCFYYDIRHFIKAFYWYLKVVVDCPMYNEDWRPIKKYSLDFCNTSTSIFSFNYTDYYKILKNAKHYCCVHGSIKDRNMIFGINPKIINKYNVFKPLAKTSNCEISYDINTFNDNGRIIIIGHSLNEVDDYILRKFFDKFRGEIIIVYYSEKDRIAKSNIIKKYTQNSNIKYFDIYKEWHIMAKYIGGKTKWDKMQICSCN